MDDPLTFARERLAAALHIPVNAIASVDREGHGVFGIDAQFYSTWVGRDGRILPGIRSKIREAVPGATVVPWLSTSQEQGLSESLANLREHGAIASIGLQRDGTLRLDILMPLAEPGEAMLHLVEAAKTSFPGEVFVSQASLLPPGKLLLAVKILQPATPESVVQMLLGMGEAVDLMRVKRALDKLRRERFLVWERNEASPTGTYSLSFAGHAFLPSTRGKQSSDIQRLLALAKRHGYGRR